MHCHRNSPRLIKRARGKSMPMFYGRKVGRHLWYRADAEVKAEFRAGLESTNAFHGEVLEFRFPRIELQKIGHLDSHQPQRGGGWVRQTGNAYLCLYGLTLSSRNPTPGGQPFDINDHFEIWTTDRPIGEGVVTRLCASNQVIALCRPISDGNADAFAARPENRGWTEVRDTPGPGLPNREIMRSAFQKILDALFLKFDAGDPMIEIIAVKIVALVSAGELDGDRLASKVLKELADDGQSTAS
jgi:hypothetical protein